MNSNFALCLKFLLLDEGGYTDNPNDSGGPTNKGITAREYVAWCHLHGSPAGDIRSISDATVATIYQQQYWQPSCDPMPKGTDYILFDMNVNMGPVQGARLLQRALKVTDDGHIGVVTMEAAMKADPKILIPAVTQEKILFYKELEREQPKDVVFDHGWMNRVANVQARAMRML
jgi:lysozyme family protein